jgi:hypothetical protein
MAVLIVRATDSPPLDASGTRDEGLTRRLVCSRSSSEDPPLMLSPNVNGRCRLGQNKMLHKVAEPVGPQFVVSCLLTSRGQDNSVVETPQELQRQGQIRFGNLRRFKTMRENIREE